MELQEKIKQQTELKKSNCIVYAFQKLVKNPFRSRYASRITLQKVEDKPFFERYTFDLGKSSEKHLIDWDIELGEGDKFTISVQSLVDTKHLI